jgi:hypothetical protein
MRIVKNIANFIKFLGELEQDEDYIYFYRGEKCNDWRSIPSLFREKSYMDYEHEMFKGLLAKAPHEFNNNDFSFNYLVKMQHYELPTRLLDLTTNPLVALYFSVIGECEKKRKSEYQESQEISFLEKKKKELLNGKIKIYRVQRKNINFFDSDKVSLLSNLAKIENILEINKIIKLYADTHTRYNNHLDILVQSKYDSIMKRLLQEIRREKPYFELDFELEDFRKILCVIPKLDNDRIKAQQGAFFLFGIANEEPEIYQEFEIDSNAKKNIKKELERLNISEDSLFPEISKIAQGIKDTYNVDRQITKTSVSTKDKSQDIIEYMKDSLEKSKGTKIENEKLRNSLEAWWTCPTEMNALNKFRQEVNVDKNLFKLALSNSLSLNKIEKKKVLDAIPTLSQFQVDELLKVWIEENTKFRDLERKNPNEIANLKFKSLKVWAKLNKENYYLYFKNQLKTQKCFNKKSNSYIFLQLLLEMSKKEKIKKEFTDQEIENMMCYPYFRQVPINITQPFDIVAS